MKTKRLKEVALVITVMIIMALGVRGLLYIWQGESTILQVVQSPDGQYVAYVYEQNGGATTDFLYHLTILKKGDALRRRAGNVYRSGSEFSVEWVSDTELYVYNMPTIEIYKQKYNIKGVIVKYKYYKE